MPPKTINPATFAHCEKKGLAAPAILPEAGFVRLAVILQVFPVGRSTFWAKVKTGEYPQPIKLGTNTTAWRVEDIRSLIAKHAGEA